MSDQDKGGKLLSIGAVARETGISIESLRMWERRYGHPKSVRLPSGHRRYPSTEVQRLRAVARALSAGYRAGEVAPATIEQLKEMLDAIRNSKQAASLPDSSVTTDFDGKTSRWMEAARVLDESTLTQEFYNDWAALGPMRFIRERVIPFLRQLGEGWSEGRISVAQEHFASERLTDFLSSMWRRMNERTSGSPFLVATLPGDNHRLGIQMCSVVTTIADRRVLYIGPQTPVEEILSASAKSRCVAVVLSVSLSVDADDARSHLERLRASLPADVRLVVGGRGAPPAIERISYISDFDDFLHWVKAQPLALGEAAPIREDFFS
jgi:DNA-binding transcriptional MerR regulator/methanogenic corrinoid protein MtbC1